jgi:hypothetical protein
VPSLPICIIKTLETQLANGKLSWDGVGRRRGEAEQARSKFSLFPGIEAIHMLINHISIRNQCNCFKNCILTHYNCPRNKSANQDIHTPCL